VGNASSPCPTWSVPTARLANRLSYPLLPHETEEKEVRTKLSAERPANRHDSFAEPRWVSRVNWRWRAR
jgi:hypothetical protein